ncbi:MAG: adenosylmethionine--8-amino-7-oxononanoate transaminase [Candidatus Polarisedimenticolia bacterium]
MTREGGAGTPGGGRGSDLAARDARVVWHPYTQHGLGIAPLPVAAARGAYLVLHDGREILDAISSWWVVLHGHAEPRIAAAIAAQAGRLDQAMFAGLTHEPAVRLAETLVAAATERGLPLARVFFSDDGSTAVEVALKMAFQYHRQTGAGERRRFVALAGAYHGDTLGAMAVGDPEGFAAPFRPLLMEADFVAPGDAAALARLLLEGPPRHAALIVEPLVQGAGGMRFHEPAFLQEAERLCRATGTLLICDEVFTGFHRTGTWLASEQAGVRPDLLTLSKGLTGGFLPLAVTLATAAIFEAFLSGDRTRAFLHGHSFTANPLGCAAALASWERLQEPDCRARIQAIGARTASHVERLRVHPRARRARSLGTIGAVDLEGPPGYFSRLGPRLAARALERGVLLRPLGNVLYAVPPLCVTDAEIDRIYATILDLLDETGEAA